MKSVVQLCVEEWISLLPHDDVLQGDDIVPYLTNCLSEQRHVMAVLKPQTEAQVINIVRIASKHHIALYTISTGHNWGYGSALPVVENCAILDLSKMITIRDFDAELGLVTLEPGVTQKQLVDYLIEHNLDFYVPTTGAGPSASIVGNALERGFGITPDEDHFRAVTSVRAVLADGGIYQSPFTEMHSANAGVWRWGIGPYIDGLFAQGNMGIITALQITLVSKPAHTEVYAFTLKKSASYEEMLLSITKLLNDMRGMVAGLKVLNREQLISTIGTDQQGMSLPRDFEWMGIGVIRCPKKLIKPIRQEITSKLKGCASQVVFVNRKKTHWLGKIFRFVPGRIGWRINDELRRANQMLDIVSGVPRALELGLVYRFVPKPEGLPVDPIRDGVGILWYAPVLPLKAALINDMTIMMKEVMARHGFPQAISFTTVSEKCAIGVIPIIYDKAAGAEKAHQCFNELWDKGNALGCPPYRVNVTAMEKLTDPTDSVYWQTVGKIKQALDPKHILSPGRYAPPPQP